MASENIRLKIEESRYKDTLTNLRTQVDHLQGCLDRLEIQRDKVNTNFTGLVADKLLEAIKQNEENIKSSINNVNKEIERIEKYLESQERVQSDLSGRFTDALNDATSVFK